MIYLSRVQCGELYLTFIICTGIFLKFEWQYTIEACDSKSAEKSGVHTKQTKLLT